MLAWLSWHGPSLEETRHPPAECCNVEHIQLIVDDVFTVVELAQDASRSNHDHRRQLRIHAERRLPADALRRAGRRRPHYLRNQMRFKSGEHSGHHDHGRESVRILNWFLVLRVLTINLFTVRKSWSHPQENRDPSYKRFIQSHRRFLEQQTYPLQSTSHSSL